MRIVADENIPLLDGFFKDMSQQLTTLPGRKICNDDLKEADVLLVRSITQVNESLLENTPVRFVGTCTIGTDHIDVEYLNRSHIQFSNAPGCNAQAVVDYVLSSLMVLSEVKLKSWQEFSVGVVGVGNVGGRLVQVLKGLGMNVVAYDPNVAPYDTDACAPEVWRQDVVTLHTPITKDGPHATYHLVDDDTLTQMKPDACLINSCRGEVVDNAALLKHLKQHDQFEAILDVWEHEPCPGDELMRSCLLATPHIAGYSLDGKYKGTAMIYDALCEYWALPKRQKLAQMIAEPPIRKLSLSQDVSADYAVKQLVRMAYDIRDDHFRMGGLVGLVDTEKAEKFDWLRKHYPLRRDTTGLTVSSRRVASPEWYDALGIRIKQ